MWPCASVVSSLFFYLYSLRITSVELRDKFILEAIVHFCICILSTAQYMYVSTAVNGDAGMSDGDQHQAHFGPAELLTDRRPEIRQARVMQGQEALQRLILLNHS